MIVTNRQKQHRSTAKKKNKNKRLSDHEFTILLFTPIYVCTSRRSDKSQLLNVPHHAFK